MESRRFSRATHSFIRANRAATETLGVNYRPLPAVLDPRAAAGHDIVSERHFRYGGPEAAFAAAPHRIAITTEYPRSGCTPIECFVVVAEQSH